MKNCFLTWGWQSWGRSNQGKGFNVSRAAPLELEKKKIYQVNWILFTYGNLYVIGKGEDELEIMSIGESKVSRTSLAQYDSVCG